MAVQTEHAKTGSEFCTRGFAVAVANAAPTNHHRTTTTDQRLPACTALPGNYYHNTITNNNNNNCNGNGTMNIMKKISSEETPQRSELTYNASASLAKKRARENQFMATFPYPPFSMEVPTTQRPPIGTVPVMGSAQRPVKQARLMDSGFHPVPSGSNFLRPLPVCGNAGVGAPVPTVNAGFSTLRGVVTGTVNANQARLVGSGSPSTSGRAALSGFKSTGLDNELVAIFQQLAADTDNIFDLEVQKIRMAIDEERKAFYRAITSEVAKSPAMQWLAQKEAELEASTRRNAELEQRLNQLSAENQTWMNIARNNESVVMKLRSKMEQSLKNGFDKNVLEEGMGDTDEVQSACRDNVPESHFSCRVCRKKDAERLIFPCRHLCICDGCDAVVSACPVCSEPKLSSIPVLFS